jgi:hypothetical protein
MPIPILKESCCGYHGVGGYPGSRSGLPRLVGYDRLHMVIGLWAGGESAMASKIFTTSAHLDSCAEMQAFLSAIPDGEMLVKVLGVGKPVSTRAYEDAAQTARFVESDGSMVVCFAVPDITIDQAEMIEAEWESQCGLDEAAFQQVVARALRESPKDAT